MEEHDVLAWTLEGRIADPQTAPAAYLEIGVYDAEHGHAHRTVDPNYQSQYDEGYAMGSYFETYLNPTEM
jgi:hypothetical protein